MKVKELIKELSKVENKDADVIIDMIVREYSAFDFFRQWKY